MQTEETSASKRSIWSWPDATLGQRAAAFVIDGLIFASTSSFLQVLMSRFYDPLAIMLVQFVFYCFYFIAYQSEGRRTLGQRVVGLRLISFHAEDIDDGVSLSILLKRELLWFPLGCLFFGAGMIAMLLRKDRMALHDVLSRTRLVTMSPEAASAPVRLSVVFGFGVAIAAALIAGVYGVTYLTPHPLRKMVHDLELLGYKVGRVKGNVSKGFVIERISFETDQITCELNGVRFDFSPVTDSRKGVSRIKNLTVEDGRIVVQKVPNGLEGALPDIRWRIGSVEFGRLVLQLPDHAPFQVKRLALSDVKIDSAQRFLKIERLWLESDPLWLDLNGVDLRDRSLVVENSSNAEIRPVFFPDILVAPVDLKFTGRFDDLELARLQLEGLGGRVKIDWNEGIGSLKIANLAPAQFLLTEMPIDKMNLTAKGGIFDGELSEISGTVVLREQNFTVALSGLQLARGKSQFAIAPLWSPNWRAQVAGREPAAQLFSHDGKGVLGTLADLYFARALNELSTSEVELIKRDLRYFVAGKIDGADEAPVRQPSAAPVTTKPETR